MTAATGLGDRPVPRFSLRACGHDLNNGECTRNIDLKGGARNINRIKFKYEETSWFLGRAVVRVYGEL